MSVLAEDLRWFTFLSVKVPADDLYVLIKKATLWAPRHQSDSCQGAGACPSSADRVASPANSKAPPDHL